MRYRLIVPATAVMTISPEQYDRLKSVGFMVRANGSVKTVYTDYSQYEFEHERARAYTHQQYHSNYPTLKCGYNNCNKIGA